MKQNKKKKYFEAQRARRARRVRARIGGTSAQPRLSVFRSNRFMYGQLIDDAHSRTIVSAYEKEVKPKGTKRMGAKDSNLRSPRLVGAYQTGALLAKRALEQKIEAVVFDRGWYRYHGRVKAFADGARAAGLKF